MINYLFSGIDKEKGFDERQTSYLKKDIKNNCNIVFIASLFDNFEKNDFQQNKVKTSFENIGIKFNKTFIIDNRVKKDEAKDIINNSDVIFLLGGSPELQMKSINDYDLASTIKEFEGIIIGVSAGAMNQTKRVIYKDEFKNNEIISYDGLSFYEESIYPHLDFKNIEFLKELFEVSKYQKLVALSNDSFIRIENKSVEYIGDYYVVDNGGIINEDK